MERWSGKSRAAGALADLGAPSQPRVRGAAPDAGGKRAPSHARPCKQGGLRDASRP